MAHINSVPYAVTARWVFYRLLQDGTFGAKAAIEKLSQGDMEMRRIPTLLKNPRILKPFELIMGLLRPPTYGTYDPTWIVA
ncbi:MAG: hypothetical protein IH955_03900, partial [Chloroflexi bacterium]|nr:hypothetical protein [Chloroflexota bacterium]